MNKIIIFFISIILISGCSFNKNSKFWTKSEIVQNDSNMNYEEVFPTEEALKKEFNSNLSIKFTSKPVNNTFINNYLQ